MRTKMLRAIAVAMMLLMVFVNVPCLAEENTDMVPITPTYLNGADIDADTWALLDTTREYFVIYMLLDCMGTWTDEAQTIVLEAMIADNCFFVEDEGSIGVFAFGDEELFMFLYEPTYGNAAYQLLPMEGVSSSLSELVLMQMKSGGTLTEYYKIDCTSVINILDEALGEN